MPDNLTKLDFGHWLQVVEIILESIRKRSKPDVVLDIIRRQETKITEDSLKVIVRNASTQLTEEEPPQSPVDSSAWDFDTTSRFLSSWFCVLGNSAPSGTR